MGSSEYDDNFELIELANKDMLDYFNKAFLNHLEDIQSVKTQIFEIDIKTDELEKTKDLYAFKSNSKKSVFSPIISDGSDTERGKIISDQLSSLADVRESLIMKLRSMEIRLGELKKHLSKLNDAADAIDAIKSAPAPEEEDDGFELLFEESKIPEDFIVHGKTVLMQSAYDKAVANALLDKKVKDSMDSVTHKLDALSYMITSDPARAKVTLHEINRSAKRVINAVDEVQTRLDYELDSTKSLKALLEEYLNEQKQAHPYMNFDTDLTCDESVSSLAPVYSIYTMKLIGIYLDNALKHANADSIEIKFMLTPTKIEVAINDDGDGMEPDAPSKAPWYSSLKKAEEIITLLGGELHLITDLDQGTKVSFSYYTNN
ncbi:MAG: sensor histidine kinase [Lachnospiraceae bacterium]|nr:sensor histidine kinase [Lachnospiraceae bacterium]